MAKKSAGVLEVLSTIVYLYNEGYEDKELEEKIKEIKAHLLKFLPEAKELAKEHFGINI